MHAYRFVFAVAEMVVEALHGRAAGSAVPSAGPNEPLFAEMLSTLALMDLILVDSLCLSHTCVVNPAKNSTTLRVRLPYLKQHHKF
jgi:hypothetical protein